MTATDDLFDVLFSLYVGGRRMTASPLIGAWVSQFTTNNNAMTLCLRPVHLVILNSVRLNISVSFCLREWKFFIIQS